MTNDKIEAIILAAGKGTRMNSSLPKVLHPIGGKPMLDHVLDTLTSLSPTQIQVVIGHEAKLIEKHLANTNVQCILQKEQLGTGHAVLQAADQINDDNIVLILYGDVPLISRDLLTQLINTAAQSSFAICTAILDQPSGYGRIVRGDKQQIIKIVEHKDANETEKKICEINTGIMAVLGKPLKKYLKQINNNNQQGEYYLTDIIEMAVSESVQVEAVVAAHPTEVEGVNNRQQQAQMERFYQTRQAEKLMLAGATVLDPNRLDIRGNVIVGQDVTIDINVIFEGNVTLGDGVKIGANSVIKNTTIAANCTILENCVIDNATLGEGCRVGPFARLRPDTILAGQNHVGNFVEIKKSSIGQGSKVNHLSYIGDTTMGEVCNIGAGCITCNYDGAFKHQTIIGDNVFVGSDSQLIAPIKIDNNVTIGAGSTLSKNVQAKSGKKETLALSSRGKIRTIYGWKRPKKTN